MAGGPSPSSTSPSIGKHSSYTATPFTSNASSPPNQNPQGLTRGMATEVAPGGASHPFNLSSPVGGRKPLDHSASSFGFSQLEHSASNPERDLLPSILIRKLPRNTGIEVLRTMLLFAKDMVDVKFVDAEYADEQGNQSAIARFMSLVGAHEAKEKLHGKALSHEGSLAVELFPNGIAFPVGRRNTLDGNSSNLRSGANSGSSVSPNGLGNGPTRQSSRFNGTFQNLERMSPPSGSHGIDTFPAPESNAHIQSLFSPQSPLANSTLSSKSIINDDPSDETGRLLNDPVAFAKNGESQAAQANARRQTNPNIALSRFAGLSLNTNNAHAQSMASPPLSGFASPRSNGVSQSQNTLMSPTGLTSLGSSSFGTNNTSNSSSYPMSPSQYQRHNYPPVNPADQNPPCNTLYVGNLPMDTSEDELKAVFSKQRGYKRLCFRTKQNGPMCFVEFEDISFATKALNDLYGHPLHNSVKGGIRLSFSKNPLGVRNGQAQSALNSPMSPHGGMNGLNGGIGAPPGFAAINGPPPGLAAPPGLAMSGMSVGSPSVNSPMGFGNYGNGAFGGSGYTSPIRQPVSSPMGSNMGGGGFPGMGGEYANFMSR